MSCDTSFVEKAVAEKVLKELGNSIKIGKFITDQLKKSFGGKK